MSLGPWCPCPSWDPVGPQAALRVRWGEQHRPPRRMTHSGRLPSLPLGVRPRAGIQYCLKEDQGTFKLVVIGLFLEKKAHLVTDSRPFHPEWGQACRGQCCSTATASCPGLAWGASLVVYPWPPDGSLGSTPVACVGLGPPPLHCPFTGVSDPDAMWMLFVINKTRPASGSQVLVLQVFFKALML